MCSFCNRKIDSNTFSVNFFVTHRFFGRLCILLVFEVNKRKPSWSTFLELMFNYFSSPKLITILERKNLNILIQVTDISIISRLVDQEGFRLYTSNPRRMKRLPKKRWVTKKLMEDVFKSILPFFGLDFFKSSGPLW